MYKTRFFSSFQILYIRPLVYWDSALVLFSLHFLFNFYIECRWCLRSSLDDSWNPVPNFRIRGRI